MVSSAETSNRNLKLEMEALKVEQEIQKKKKNKEDEQKKLTLSWEVFSGAIVFCFIWVWLGYWILVVLFALFAIFGLYGIISESNKVKNLEREITRLKTRKKDLRNSIR